MSPTQSDAPVRARNQVDLDHHGPEFRDELPKIIAELHATGHGLAWSTAY